ncbi:MAG: LacI family DNA-binding transcriptional regulator [Pseudomonadota bacterium]
MAKPAKGTARVKVSIRDVARRAGVSIASVSRAVNDGGSVSDDTRRRVMAAVEELNYSPNHIGRALRAQTTNTFALILSNIQNNFFAAVAWELERLLSARGQAMLLYTSNENPRIQDRCLDDIQARQVSGVFLLCAVESGRLEAFSRGHDTVLINRRVRTLPDLPFVGIDDRAASRELVEIALRRRQGPIGIIHGPLSSDTSARRLEGMLAACAEAGLDPAPELVREAELSMESGYEAASALLSHQGLAALFCGNDQISYGAYRRCRELGIKVPEELPIFGFDDNPLNEWLAPWLNTVRVPHLAYAKSALGTMDGLKRDQGAGETILPYEIVLRS